MVEMYKEMNSFSLCFPPAVSIPSARHGDKATVKFIPSYGWRRRKLDCDSGAIANGLRQGKFSFF